MATVQQSIDIQLPLHAVYNCLTHFEDYPEFMEEVEHVQRLGDSHLHWTTRMANRSVEWDAEITSQETDRCIAWRNTSGPTNSGRVELQEAGPQASHVTITLESEPQQVPGSMAGENETEMARRLKMDLARMKDFIEGQGTEQEAWRSQEHGAPITTSPAERERGAPRNAPVPTSAYAAGSEGWTGEEDSTAPVRTAPATASATPQQTAAQRNDAAGSAASHVQSSQGKSERAMTPDASGNAAVGGTAAAVGAAGGTDASAGAAMAGGPRLGGAQAGSGTVTGQGATAPGAGASAAGGTGLGTADQDAGAGDTRSVPRGAAPRTAGSTPAAGKTGNSGGRNRR